MIARDALASEPTVVSHSILLVFGHVLLVEVLAASSQNNVSDVVALKPGDLATLSNDYLVSYPTVVLRVMAVQIPASA